MTQAGSASTQTALSVVITIDGESEVSDLFAEYRAGLDELRLPYEVVCVVNENAARTVGALQSLAGGWPQLRLMPHRPWQGEDAAFAAALSQTRGDLVLTLPGWREVDVRDVGRLLESLDDGADMVTGFRAGREPSAWRKFRARCLQGLLRALFGFGFKDLFCPARIGRREVFEAVASYGVRRHFLPLIAAAKGYVVRETELPGNPRRDAYRFKPAAHVSALIDVLALYVTLNFLDRPLRFFGFVGLPLLLLGLAATAWLVVERLFFGMALAERPALVISVLMIVLGVQILALGLIGEIIVFSSSRRARTYEVGRIVSRAPESRPAVVPVAETAEQPARGAAVR